MTYHITFCAAVCIILCPHQTSYCTQTAVICTPIADLFGEPLQNNHHHKKIPVCGVNQCNITVCPRIHQALFNEIVTIIDKTDTEYYVEIPNAYYVTEKSDTPHARYWMRKENGRILKNKSAELEQIPIPITFKNSSSVINSQTITLIKPWHDQFSHKTFSVGTRFIHASDKSTAEMYAITFCDAHKKKVVTRLLPKRACILSADNITTDARRATMVQILRQWIDTSTYRRIPYVWGGCSYTHHYKGPYTEIHAQQHTTPHTFYDYAQSHIQSTHAGFDCAGLILRAAQCAGIPFFCKNSYTIQKKLTPIRHYADIRPGDIIWIPGHVIVIADLERNTIIEARGYPHGYGKVQEIPLSEQFKGIFTFKHLMHAYNKGLPLRRLNKEGMVVSTIPSYKILKLF